MPNPSPQTPVRSPTAATMYCLGCGYILDGLPEPRCPECGRAFDPEIRSTYLLVSFRYKAVAWLSSIALLLGLTPLIFGTLVFSLFCLVQEEWTVVTGGWTIIAGVACFILGTLCLAVCLGLQLGKPWNQTHSRRAKIAGLVLPLNFPAAILFVVSAYWIITCSTVTIINLNTAAFNSVALSQADTRIELGDIPPGGRVKKNFWITSETPLTLTGTSGDTAIETDVEVYPIPSIGYKHEIILEADGKVTDRRLRGGDGKKWVIYDPANSSQSATKPHP